MIIETRPTSHSSSKFFWLVAISSLAVFLTALIATLNGMQRVTTTAMPDLTNKSMETARSILRVKRLKMEVSGYRFDQRVAVNLILEQTPLSGQTIDSRQTVKVVVSRGARTLNIPNLSNMAFKEAVQQLNQSGLILGRVTRCYTSDAPKDTVLDQFPAAGSAAARGTSVHVLLSQGPSPRYFIMPEFKNRLVDDAAALLGQIGAEIKEIKREPSDAKPNGTILGQTPKPGVRIQAGDPVGLLATLTSAAANQASRFVTIEYVVPPKDNEVRVKLVLRDNTGLHEIYNAMEKPNARVSIKRTVPNGSVKLLIYLNGTFLEERAI